MSEPSDRLTLLSDEDRAFVERIASVYKRAPMSPERAIEFDERLEQRLERRQLPWLVPSGALAAVATVGLAIWLALPGSESPQHMSLEPVAGSEISLEDGLLSLTSGSEIDRDSSLPEDYRAIASLFMEGV